MPTPGKLPSTAAGTMGVFKLSFPEADQSAPNNHPKSSFRGTASSFMGRRFNTKVQPTLRSFLESPDLDDIPTTTPKHTDPVSSSSEDDSSSHFTASTRTSNTLSSDDDASLRELSLRSTDFLAPARHSTACCTDLTLRRELRKKFPWIEPSEARAECRNSFAMGHSFRRELEIEDRVESLALWEETEMSGNYSSQNSSSCALRKDMSNGAHSWPHGENVSTGSSLGSGRSKGLESLFRKPKKVSSFFNGFFSGFSRRSRKL